MTMNGILSYSLLMTHCNDNIGIRELCQRDKTYRLVGEPSTNPIVK